MRQTVYISLSVCLLAFSACGDDISSPQVEESCILYPDFRPEGLLSIQASTGTRAALQTENGEVGNVGVCITAENSHQPYLSRRVSRYTFSTEGIGYEGIGTGEGPMPPFYLTYQNAAIQAFHPSTETATESGVSDYTIPVTISSTQLFRNTADRNKLQCVTTDYLYGSALDIVGDATLVYANDTHTSPAIYMHHALTKVVFTLQFDDNRTPNAACDCVKSIRMTAASGNPFLWGAGTMQIKDGALAGLSATNELIFTPAGGAAPVAVGVSGTPSMVACGLVAPLSGTPGNITLAVTLGKHGENTYDRTYTATNTAFNVQWQKGYCYTYNLVLGSELTTTSNAITWTEISAPADIEAKERGIGSASELKAFRDTWNAHGLQLKKGKTGEYDYTLYEPYGWYDKNNNGQFTIKLTSDITLNEAADSWIPLGIESTPLTIPFDGQGWKVILQLQSKAMEIKNQVYSGFIGYAQADIKNLSVVAYSLQEVTADNNKIESTGATYTGGLAGYVEGNIINCAVDLKGTDITNSPPSGATGYMGGLVGYCQGNIYNSAVCTTQVDGDPVSVNLSEAATGSCIGGLAGQVVNGQVINCYTRLENLECSASGGNIISVSAGWLVGYKTGITFENTYYMAGNSSLTTDDSQTGANVFTTTDWTTLCTSLNHVASARDGWAKWQEEKDSGTGVTQKVILKLK